MSFIILKLSGDPKIKSTSWSLMFVSCNNFDFLGPIVTFGTQVTSLRVHSLAYSLRSPPLLILQQVVNMLLLNIDLLYSGSIWRSSLHQLIRTSSGRHRIPSNLNGFLPVPWSPCPILPLDRHDLLSIHRNDTKHGSIQCELNLRSSSCQIRALVDPNILLSLTLVGHTTHITSKGCVDGLNFSAKVKWRSILRLIILRNAFASLNHFTRMFYF